MLKFVLGFIVLLNFANAFALEGASGDSLGEGLSLRKKTFTEKMPKEVVDLFEKNIKEQKASGIESQSLKVGDKVPDVLVDLGGKKVQLSRIYAEGPVVLKFYRGGWCPYCLMELKHYQKMNAEFKKAGAQILAIAPDNAEQIRETKTKNSLSYDVVSDHHQAIAKQFKLVYKVHPKIAEVLKKSGIDLSVYHGDNENELSIPGTFLVGKDGIVAFAYVDADYRQRAEPSIVLQAVKALK